MGMLLVRHRLNNADANKNMTKASDLELTGPLVATSDVEEVAEAETKPAYNRTQINRLSTSELQKLAKSEGLDASLSGAKLKEILIKHFGI